MPASKPSGRPLVHRPCDCKSAGRSRRPGGAIAELRQTGRPTYDPAPDTLELASPLTTLRAVAFAENRKAQDV